MVVPSAILQLQLGVLIRSVFPDRVSPLLASVKIPSLVLAHQYLFVRPLLGGPVLVNRDPFLLFGKSEKGGIH